MPQGTLRILTIEIVQDDGDDARFTEALNSGLAAMQRECRAVASFARIHSVRQGNPQEVIAGFGEDPLAFPGVV
jgi:hypothetical protein